MTNASQYQSSLAYRPLLEASRQSDRIFSHQLNSMQTTLPVSWAMKMSTKTPRHRKTGCMQQLASIPAGDMHSAVDAFHRNNAAARSGGGESALPIEAIE